SRIERLQSLVADAQTIHHAGAKAFDDDIGLFDELQKNLAPALVFQIDRDAALVAIRSEAVGSGSFNARATLPRRIAHAGLFDLDDRGGESGERHRGDSARQQQGQIQNSDVIKWFHFSGFLSFGWGLSLMIVFFSCSELVTVKRWNVPNSEINRPVRNDSTAPSVFRRKSKKRS